MRSDEMAIEKVQVVYRATWTSGASESHAAKPTCFMWITPTWLRTPRRHVLDVALDTCLTLIGHSKSRIYLTFPPRIIKDTHTAKN